MNLNGKRDDRTINLDTIFQADYNPLVWIPKLLDKPSDWWGHIPFAFWIVAVCKPRVLVELGTHYGVPYAAFCEAIHRLRFETRSYAVDKWTGEHQASSYGEDVYTDLKRFNDLHYAAFSQLIRMEFDEGKDQFSDNTVDLLHINGYHSYDAVSQVYNLWLPKLSNRAVVLFHNTNVRQDDFGVWRFFEELAQTTPCFEFSHSHGLGVAAVGTEAPPVVQELCRLDGDHAIAPVRDTFSQLGRLWISVNESLLAGKRRQERLDRLEPELNEKAEALEGAKKELALSRATLAEKDRLIAARERQIVQTAAGLASRDRELTKRTAELAEKEAQLAEKEAQLAEKGAQVAEQDRELTKMNAELAQKEAQLSEESNRCARVEFEREEARAARASIEREASAQISRVIGDRDFLAGYLSRTFRRPWRPIKHYVSYNLLRSLGALTAPYSERTASRLKRSAQKRSPSRFDTYLSKTANLPSSIAFAPNASEIPGSPEAVHPEAASSVAYDPTPPETPRSPETAGPGADSVACISAAPEIPGSAETVNAGAGLSALSGPAAPLPHERPLSLVEIAQVQRPIDEDPLVSVIIQCGDDPHSTLQCLRSIAEHPPALPFEIIVAGDPGVELVRSVEGIRLRINDVNVGFSRSSNLGGQIAKGSFLFLLNSATLVKEGWLEPLLEVFQNFPNAGLVGSKLLFADGKLREAGGIVWNDGSAWNYGRSDDPAKPEYNYVREVDYSSGCAFLMSRQLWEQLGGFDESFSPGYWEDADLAFRIRAAGKKVYYCPFSVIVHLEGITHATDVKSGVKAYQTSDADKFKDRWHGALARDHFPPGTQIMRARDGKRGAKIALVVDRYVPQPDQDAGSRTMITLIDCLRTEGYVVKLWPHTLRLDPDYTPDLQSSGVEVIYGDYQSFERWIKENGEVITLAVLSRPSIASIYIGQLRLHSEAELVYYGHDLHFQRMGMEAKRAKNVQLASDAIFMEGLERAIWRQVDLVLYCSPEETALARSASVHAATIVPYAYDEFSGDREPPSNREIIFVAGFAHQPNADAAVWLVSEVLPLIRAQASDATLSIVGANPTEAVRALAGDRVEVTGRVTEDELRARYARARIALVPLRIGAGVKSKVVEALREGLPLVTTTVGAQGLRGVAEFVQIADDAAGLAEAAARLLVDDSLWKRASLRQVAYAREHFSRAAFRRSLLDAICHQSVVAAAGREEAGEANMGGDGRLEDIASGATDY